MKKKKLAASNFWPGYVDALVNIVLNILFMVGLMAVGLVSLNIEALGNYRAVKKVSAIAQISEDYILLAALGTLVAAWGETPEDSKNNDESSSNRINAEISKSETKPKVESVEHTFATKVDELVTLNQESSLVSINIKNVASPASAYTQSEQLQGQIDIDRNVHYGYIEFKPFEFGLSDKHLDILKALVDKSVRESTWQVVTFTDENDQIRREAFWRLSATRQKLVDYGLPPQQIAIKSVTTSDSRLLAAKRVFVFYSR